jgi:5-methylcytosine-specific restriction endonuclease McrA
VELDPESRRFQQEVDELVRRWAGGDEHEYWRRWKQLGSWSINRTQGDVVKKAALKKTLMAKTGGKCMGCGNVFEPAGLQMHRLDPSLARDRALNFGYVESNVELLCAGCHERREAARR